MQGVDHHFRLFDVGGQSEQVMITLTLRYGTMQLCVSSSLSFQTYRMNLRLDSCLYFTFMTSSNTSFVILKSLPSSSSAVAQWLTAIRTPPMPSNTVGLT